MFCLYKKWKQKNTCNGSSNKSQMETKVSRFSFFSTQNHDSQRQKMNLCHYYGHGNLIQYKVINFFSYLEARPFWRNVFLFHCNKWCKVNRFCCFSTDTIRWSCPILNLRNVTNRISFCLSRTRKCFLIGSFPYYWLTPQNYCFLIRVTIRSFWCPLTDLSVMNENLQKCL